MVLCRYFNPRAECDDLVVATVKRSYCCKSPLDCAKIAGCDHLKEQRARMLRCKSKRIRQLAQPKYLTEKYQREEPRMVGPRIEVVRSYEEETPTRIKLLAYPKVRKLISAKEDYKEVIDSQQKHHYEYFIQRSYQTMYSKLAKVQLPVKTKHTKWTAQDWKRHCRWLKKRAVPRTLPTPPKPPKSKTVSVSPDELKVSMQKLSTPNPRCRTAKFRPVCGYKSTVKNLALYYTPNQRILNLANPKERKEKDDYDPFKVDPRVLKYKISEFTSFYDLELLSLLTFFVTAEGIERLAIAKTFRPPADDENITQFGVLKRALKATLGERTVKLSQPKENIAEDENEEKPLVNPKALKAKPTKRILKLAEPRVTAKR